MVYAIYLFILLIRLTAQRLNSKVCRALGSKACLKMHAKRKKSMFGVGRREKSMIVPIHPQTCSHVIYAQMLIQESAKQSGCFLPANFIQYR